MKVRALLGKKIGMTQLFDETGEVIAVTAVVAGPCTILEKKSSTGKDRYSAVKIGFEKAKEKVLTKPQLGFFKKLDVAPLRHVREVRVSEEQLGEFEVGGELDATLFEVGDIVNITAKGKGHGFAGVIKRWNFAGRTQTHGTHESKRGPGAVGCSTWPGKIWKGKKMPGQYGNKPVVKENLEVVQVIPEQNLLLLKGSVPGHRNSLLLIKNSVKKWKRD
jgi:large subunit ribosomal protein L3